MAASTAMPGYGTTLKWDTATIATATFGSAALAEVKAIGIPGITTTAIDVTHLSSDSNSREFIASKMVDFGTITLRCAFLPTTVNANYIVSAGLSTGPMARLSGWKITWTDASPDNWKFDGVVTDVGVVEFGVDDSPEATVTIKISGLPVFTSA